MITTLNPFMRTTECGKQRSKPSASICSDAFISEAVLSPLNRNNGASVSWWRVESSSLLHRYRLEDVSPINEAQHVRAVLLYAVKAAQSEPASITF